VSHIMDISKNLNDALNYAKKMFDDLGRLVVLIVLGVIPIVNFAVMGYAARVLKTSPKANRPPMLEGYVDMWIQGLKIAVVTVIYMIIPILILGAGIVSIVTGIFGAGFGNLIRQGGWKGGPDTWDPSVWKDFGMFASPAFIGFGALLIIIGLIIIFIILLIHLIGISNMIKKDNLGKAFAFSEIFNIVGKIGWGSYILWLIIMFVLFIIVSGLRAIPGIGWIVMAIIFPVFLVFLGRALGSMYEIGAKTRTKK